MIDMDRQERSEIGRLLRELGIKVGATVSHEQFNALIDLIGSERRRGVGQFS